MPWVMLRVYRDVIIFSLAGLLFLLMLKSRHYSGVQEIQIFSLQDEVKEEICDTKSVSIREYIRTPLLYDDPRLVQHIRNNLIWPPSKEPYHLNKTEPDAQYSAHGIEDFFNVLFQEKKGRIFIEAGAGDGEKDSTTLWLEKEMGWKGLLVEGDPVFFPDLRSKHRKSWVAPVCISPTMTPESLTFTQVTITRGQSHLPLKGVTTTKIWMCPVNGNPRDLEPIVGMPDSEAELQKCKPPRKRLLRMVCVPLMSLMLAVNYTTIDLLSLNIVGSELHVLTTLPYRNLNIKLLLIGKDSFTSPETIIALMKIRGFNRVRRVGRYLLSEELPSHFLFLNENYTTFPLP